MKSTRLRKSLIVFFIIAVGVPWIGWSAIQVFGFSGPVARYLLYVGDFCSVGGLVAAYVANGTIGLREMAARAVHFKFPAGWWLLVILLPFSFVAFAFVLWGALKGGLLDVNAAGFWRMFSLPALAMFLTGPLGEEFGWRGYLLPVILRKNTVLTSGVVVGLIWGVWHYPLYFDGIFASAGTGGIFVAGTVLTSVLLSVIFVYSGGSILAPILFHWLINVLPITFGRMFGLSDVDLGIEVLQLVPRVLAILLLYFALGPKSIEAKKAELIETLYPRP